MIRQSVLLCVAAADVPEVWPHVADMIDRAYEAVDQITPDVRTWLIEGKGLLWVALTDDQTPELVACLTTSLELRRGGLACRMMAAAGTHLHHCLSHLHEIELYAAAEGCYMVEIEGRQGWSRVLPGYAPRTVRLRKAIVGAPDERKRRANHTADAAEPNRAMD